MKIRQLRATFEEFASICATEGQSERADALRALSRALQAADAKHIDEVVPVLERIGSVARDAHRVSSRQ